MAARKPEDSRARIRKAQYKAAEEMAVVVLSLDERIAQLKQKLIDAQLHEARARYRFQLRIGSASAERPQRENVVKTR